MKHLLSAFLLVAAFSFSLGTIAQEQIFEYTGAVQTYVVPIGATSIKVEMAGAGGGFSSWESEQFHDKYKAGKGGHLTATYPVTPGEELYIFVGEKGHDATDSLEGRGGFNGGGKGNNTGTYGPYCGGGGGGASDIRIGGAALSNRVLIVGGGGGAGSNYPNGGDHGGNGGSLIGTDGRADNGTEHVSCGRGATQKVGGEGGQWSGYLKGDNGEFGIGGDAADSTAGGGGGGGYYGGGAGSWSGGGGGSSFSNVEATEIAHEQGVNSDHGYIRITPIFELINTDEIVIQDTITEPQVLLTNLELIDPTGTEIQDSLDFYPIQTSCILLCRIEGFKDLNPIELEIIETDTVEVEEENTTSLIIQNNSEVESINVYPNPSSGYINVVGKNINTIELYTIQGDFVMLSSNMENIDVSSLARGTYLIMARDINRQFIGQEKIIIQ